jgi:lambda family phage holin
MPEKDPQTWQWLANVLSSNWPQLYAAVMAFVVALVRALHAGGRPVRSLLEAVLCGCLTLSLSPVLSHFGLSQNMAVAIGAMIAFLGVDWLRDRAGSVLDKFLGRWLK